jgi:hypothetical protein
MDKVIDKSTNPTIIGHLQLGPFLRLKTPGGDFKKVI